MARVWGFSLLAAQERVHVGVAVSRLLVRVVGVVGNGRGSTDGRRIGFN